MKKRFNSYYFYAGPCLTNSLDSQVLRDFPNSEFCEVGSLELYRRVMEDGLIAFLYTLRRRRGFPPYKVVPTMDFASVPMELSILCERLNKFFLEYCCR